MKLTKICLVTAALFVSIALPAQVIPPPGRVAVWHGEGNANDSTGGNDGSLQGGVAFAPGPVGDAFSFDGTFGFIEIANTPNMDFGSGDFSIIAWVRFHSLDADQTIFHKLLGVAPDDQAYYLEFQVPNLLRFAVRETITNKNDLFVSVPLVPNNWYLVAAVRQGDTNALYLNGSLIGGQVAGAKVNTGIGGNARIGRLVASGATSEARFFSGAMDEVSLYRRALAGSEIQSLFNAGNLSPAFDSMNSISFQGALNGPNGQPLPNGTYDLMFKFYDVPTSRAIFGSSAVSNVVVSGGIASAVVPVSGAWFNGQTRYLGISLNGGPELSPRIIVTTVPYALKPSSLIVPSPFDARSYVPQQQGLELRWYQDTPFIDFTRSLNPSRDFDYRIYVTSPDDPRFVIGSDITQNGIVIRRNGLVGIGGPFPETALDFNGTARMVVCQITSDRNVKTNFASVTAREILGKVAALPISTWAYTNASGIRHIEPVAQDFHAAFAVGEDDKHIATVDADGIALAAIQGPNQKLEEELSERSAQIHDLENRLKALERKLESRFAANERR